MKPFFVLELRDVADVFGEDACQMRQVHQVQGHDAFNDEALDRCPQLLLLLIRNVLQMLAPQRQQRHQGQNLEFLLARDIDLIMAGRLSSGTKRRHSFDSLEPADFLGDADLGVMRKGLLPQVKYHALNRVKYF